MQNYLNKSRLRTQQKGNLEDSTIQEIRFELDCRKARPLADISSARLLNAIEKKIQMIKGLESKGKRRVIVRY